MKSEKIVISNQYLCAYLRTLAAFSSKIRFLGETTSNGLLAYEFEPKREIKQLLEEYETDLNHPSFKDVFFYHFEFMSRVRQMNQSRKEFK